uniref:Uncharacterized protein n=1 Tax=Aegilops tauschii subsp. strangulata TaxID=200361 RepID=A0A453N3B3_AEGTS
MQILLPKVVTVQLWLCSAYAGCWILNCLFICMKKHETFDAYERSACGLGPYDFLARKEMPLCNFKIYLCMLSARN